MKLKIFTPYLTILIALLLVSKIPTLIIKKNINFIKNYNFFIIAVGIIFIALLFYTFETLLIFGFLYLISIPISIFILKKTKKKNIYKNI